MISSERFGIHGSCEKFHMARWYHKMSSRYANLSTVCCYDFSKRRLPSTPLPSSVYKISSFITKIR